MIVVWAETNGYTFMSDFEKSRQYFHLPDGLIYLDGNSLGPLPVNAVKRVSNMMQNEWGQLLIRGWNAAGWMQQPEHIGNRIAKLIGAAPDTVVMGDTLSIKVYQALAAAIALNPDRRLILSDVGNFPTDLYMAEGLLKTLGDNYLLKLVTHDEIANALDESVAVLMLTQVDYQTGRLYDMQELTDKAHAKGVVTVWDLAHSAGALPVDLAGADVDFAVGCTYKYLNGGPGAPAFIYVAPRYADNALPALSGWLGHQAPFEFETGYRGAESISRMRVGTPPVIALAALDAALDVWDSVDLADLRARSIELCELFITEVEKRCPQLTLASPRNAAERGSQVSFHFENGYAVIQALIATGVIGDFRAPDVMRFGFTPLYINAEEVIEAAVRLEDIMNNQTWDQPMYHQRSAVT